MIKECVDVWGYAIKFRDVKVIDQMERMKDMRIGMFKIHKQMNSKCKSSEMARKLPRYL